MVIGILKAAWSGISTGLCPIGLIIIAALFTYALTVKSGAMQEIREGLASLSSQHEFLALLLIWGFGSFMEGMAGFGTAVAIPAAILTGLGLNPFKVVMSALVVNTVNTAYGSVGVSSTVLALEAGVDLAALSAVEAWLQLGVMALGPWLILFIFGGFRSIRENFRLGLIADIAFVVPNFLTAYYMGPELPNIVGGLVTMAVFAALGDRSRMNAKRQFWAWGPFLLVIAALGVSVAIPKEWRLTPGVWVLGAAILGGLWHRISPRVQLVVMGETILKYKKALIIICSILALARILVYLGVIAYLANQVVALAGGYYRLFAPCIGALGGFITGSGTSSNVLFGSLQASIATNGSEALLFAADNVMGAGIGKMICVQSIVLGCAAAGIAGEEKRMFLAMLKYFVPVILLAMLSSFILFPLAMWRGL